MPEFDIQSFMELVFKLYSEKLRKLQRVKFMLLEKDAVRSAVNGGVLRVLREMTP